MYRYFIIYCDTYLSQLILDYHQHKLHNIISAILHVTIVLISKIVRDHSIQLLSCLVTLGMPLPTAWISLGH